MHKLKISLLIMTVLGTLSLIFAKGVSLAEPRQVAAAIVVQDADTTLSLASTQSAGLANKIDAVENRFVMRFANMVRFVPLPAVPTQLTTKLDVVEARFVTRFANTLRQIDIPILPATLEAQLDQVRDRIVLRFANRVEKTELTYPKGWRPESNGPAISNVQTEVLSANSVRITWTTDEFATSQVDYGIQSGSYSNDVTNDTFVIDHDIVLTGLTANTRYYFQVISRDLDDNQSQSGEEAFITTVGSDPTPTAPTGLALSGTPDTSATFTWTAHPDFQAGWGYKLYYDTDTAQPPFSGTGLSEGNSPIDVGNVTQFTVTGLDPQQTYFVAVTVYDQNGLESSYSNIVSVSSNSTLPTLQLSPGSLNFEATAGGSNPASQGLTVSTDSGRHILPVLIPLQKGIPV